MTIHERIAERMELAGIYATDGAFRSAAKILRDLADERSPSTRIDATASLRQ